MYEQFMGDFPYRDSGSRQVYQQSLVTVVNFSFFISLVTFSCIQLYLFSVNMTRLDQLSYPRAYYCTLTLKHNEIKCMYVCM